MAALLAREGQRGPVLVVVEGDARYVLIDVYRRTDALVGLGRYLVEIAVLPMAAPEPSS